MRRIAPRASVMAFQALLWIALISGCAPDAEEPAPLSKDPALLAIYPASGSPFGGTQVALEGRNFTAESQVFFAGVPAPKITRSSSTQLLVETPPMPPSLQLLEPVSVAVRNADSRDSVRSDLFTYAPRMTVQRFAPFHGGGGKRSMAVADFNGDGKRDLVRVVYGGYVELLLGEGNGSFRRSASGRLIPDFAEAGFGVEVGDLNADGKLDVVAYTSSHLDLQVGFFAGDGQGGLGTLVEQRFGMPVDRPLIADLNGDQKSDLILGIDRPSAASGGILIYLSNGIGSFQPAVQLVSGVRMHDLWIEDFNGDGKQDIAALTDFVPVLRVYLGNGLGGHTLYRTYAGIGASSMTAADMNGDGKQDLILRGSGLKVVLGSGFGDFGNPIFSPDPGGQILAVVDHDGDGKSDILSTSSAYEATSTLSIQLGDGTGRLAATQILNNDYYNNGGIIAADWNQDNKLDLALNYPGELEVLLAESSGGYRHLSPSPHGLAPNAATVGDWNGDGHLDVAVTNKDSSDVTILLGDGAGDLHAATVYPVGTTPSAILHGDFNGDRLSDLAILHRESNSVSVLLGNGVGGFGAAVHHAVGMLPMAIVAGDLNRDGHLDLATANNATSDVSLLFGDGRGGFGSAQNLPVGTGPTALASADLNHDDALDLIVDDHTGHAVRILHGLGDGRFRTPVLGGPYGSGTMQLAPVDLIVADFDGDNIHDLVIYDAQLLGRMYLGDGSGGFADIGASYLRNLSPTPISGDWNGDGRLDIAGRYGPCHNEGNGSFLSAYGIPHGGIEGYNYAAVGDFNQDHFPDFIFLFPQIHRVVIGLTEPLEEYR